MSSSQAPLLSIRDLTKVYRVRPMFAGAGYEVRAVDGVSLDILPGETVGIVGESGCGKSTIGRMLVGLTPPSGGVALLDGSDLLAQRSRLRRARDVQMVFQDPYSSLNPTFSVRQILLEGLSKHPDFGTLDREEALRAAIARVGLSPRLLDSNPHQLSGGQRQRVGVARALALNPRLLIADEPTSALDVSVQAQILDLLIELQQATGLAMMLISHDFSVVLYLCDRVAVMYLGRLVETGPTAEIFASPAHHYTAGLMQSVPGMATDGRRGQRIMAGELPSPLDVPKGCPFHPRCPAATDICRTTLPKLERRMSRSVACHHPLS